MRLKIKKIPIVAGRPIAFIPPDAAKTLNIHFGERIEIKYKNKSLICLYNTLKGLINKSEISLSEQAQDFLKARSGSYVEIKALPSPKSLAYILKKMKNGRLSREEIFSIIRDVVNNVLNEAEIAYFISAVYENGMDAKETLYLIEAMYRTGSVLEWGKIMVADKHSIGGIAGNRTTPIIVSICSCLGIVMPKTSSRAISSASGTADVIETIAKVDFPSQELKKIVRKTGACLAWGGSLGLAPADDKLIRVEKMLKIDPESQLIASIMAKKLAVGSKYVLIDIPYGKNAKVNLRKAIRLKRKFLAIGKHFKLKMRVLLTKGEEPIGNGIGPVLEMKDVLRVLRQEDSPKDLETKSLMLAGEILEMTGKARKGLGYDKAREILVSGLALKKFNQIVDTQGRKRLPLNSAKLSWDVKAIETGTIKEINNKMINEIARKLGCPVSIRAGVYLYKHNGDKVRKGEVIMTLYSESQVKMKDALRYLRGNDVIQVS